MFDYRAFVYHRMARIAPKYLPFADVATDEVPLSRLLRLSLFQVTVGMALVLMAGTLNRVMIVELGVPASLVAGMLALPLIFAPFRTLIGFKSDTFSSALGWRRTPFIWKGSMWQFGGFAIMPFALLVLSGYGEAIDAPRWIGLSSAALSFLLVGAGMHMVQTVGLALATDLVKEEAQPRVVGLMYVMLLFGMVIAAFVFGALLENYTPGRLIQVIQGCAVLTLILNCVAMWKQEARDRSRAEVMFRRTVTPKFVDHWRQFIRYDGALRLLIVIGLGTLAYGMVDVLLEPYGGQVLAMSVADTTKLTAVLAGGTLVGFGYASMTLGRNGAPLPLARAGIVIGVPGFFAIIAAAFIGSIVFFVTGAFAIGVGAGLFGHGTLTATMRRAPEGHVGLALGAWGAVQATAAGIGVALGGIVRDIVLYLPFVSSVSDETPYVVVFAIEAVLLVLALIVALSMRDKRIRTANREIVNSRTPKEPKNIKMMGKGREYGSLHPTHPRPQEVS